MQEQDNDQHFVGNIGAAVGHEEEENDEKGEDKVTGQSSSKRSEEVRITLKQDRAGSTSMSLSRKGPDLLGKHFRGAIKGWQSG